MRKFITYSIIGFVIVLFSACAASMQTYDLSDEYSTSLHIEGTDGKVKEAEVDEKSELVGVPARNYYNGDLKRGAIWWANEGITLEKGSIFIFTATNIGPDKTPFGATFPPIDLIKDEVVLKITARAEGQDGQIPELHLQFDDASGYQANAKRPFVKIENSEEFKVYYFDIRGMFMQNEPKKHKVNGAMINSLKFYINPGQEAFNGKIYFQKIEVVPVSEMESPK